MKCTIQNPEQWAGHKAEIDRIVNAGKMVNLSYEPAKAQKTKAQMGFVFGAILSQVQLYLYECGTLVSPKAVRNHFYIQVAKILPDIVESSSLWANETRIMHIDEYDKETMSKFIDACFTVLDTDPLLAGIKLTPDTYFNWVFHTDPEIIRNAQQSQFPQHDQNYLNYIRTLPCIICGIQHRSEAHHLKHPKLCGLTQKAPDWAALPLCHKCHMGIAHGTGFKDRMNWLPIDIIDFLRLNYMRYLNLDF